jgi:outer membrane receptor protein involved in Fe transport
LYGTNVNDEEYRVTSNATYNTTGLVGAAFGDPRQYGVTLRYSW